MEVFTLLIKTVVLRPYVFLFLVACLLAAHRLIGWRRTTSFVGITWLIAFICEFSSTRTGIPFGWYHYTGSTVGQELYLSNIPVADSLSFSFLLYSSYCLALAFLLPASHSPDHMLLRLRFPLSVRTGWPTILLTTVFFTFIDIVIDPVALRGDRWFLGKFYYYPDPGVHFGVPIANYVGWAVVSLMSLTLYLPVDRRLDKPAAELPGSVTGAVLLGCGLYYVVLTFNLAVTFWIDEPLLGTSGLLIYLPITILLLLRLLGRLPAPS